MSDGVHIRPARRGDAELILGLVRELAAYEKLAHEVIATAADVDRELFGERPVAETLIGEWEGRPEGMALFFHNFSTFLGRPGIYLEDLYVREAARGQGLGRALLAAVAQVAMERGCGRLEWSVLDWNESALGFYRALGASAMDGWTVHRVTGDALAALARRD